MKEGLKILKKQLYLFVQECIKLLKSLILEIKFANNWNYNLDFELLNR